jgi:hydroxyacylglutathione hydrolase
MSIIPIPAFTDNYIWAIVDEESRVFDCVDPGEANPVLQFAQTKQLNLRTILLTHHHYDHIGGVDALVKQMTDCIVYGPDDVRIPYITNKVQEHQTINIGQYSFQIVSNPGHTSSHISYYEPNKGWLFCGDTLFSAGCGKVFDGTLNELYHSIQLFKALPPQTKVFCAHEYTKQNLRFAQTVEPNNQFAADYLNKIKQSTSCTLPSTIEIEQLINPFFRTDQPEVQIYAQKHGAASRDSLEVFRVLREQKNLFR